MVDHSITNMRGIYWNNDFYRYPIPWLKTKINAPSEYAPGSFLPTINTGWHIIPNLLWGHLASPRQWWEMVQKFEAISVKSVSTKIFNPIPIQTALSFQGTSTFPAFNNTVYSMTYTDDLYETPWFDWRADIYNNSSTINMYYEWNPAFKEGSIPKPVSNTFPVSNDCAKDRTELEEREDIYPKCYTSKTTAGWPGSMQNLSYRRQFLPIYYYSYPFPQYDKVPGLSAWRDTNTWWENCWYDPSGIFWDPLNRPEHIGELRPGKNMIEFSWHVHPVDDNIWFNTDRIALLSPYPRPRPLQINRANINLVDVPAPCNPITPGPPLDRYGHLKQMGLVKEGEALRIPTEVMAPESHTGLPDWRQFPIVPMRWFLKEIEESNPYINETINKVYYREALVGSSTNRCPTLPQTGPPDNAGLKTGDVEITAPMENARLPGTEYEMYKYPPTQWFIKGVPLFDDKDNLIPVQMQAFMITTVTLKGKPRRSAIYAPTWGPILAQDLYSVNMDTSFGENYIRGRSGGARRTWLNPEEPRPVTDPRLEDLWLFDDDTGSGNPKTSIPRHPKRQCIIEPRSEQYRESQWPRKAVFQPTNGTMNVTIDRSGKRYVEARDKSSGKCFDGKCTM